MSASTTIPANAQWFAVHTLSGQENKVKNYIEKFKKAEELDDAIFEVLLPTDAAGAPLGVPAVSSKRNNHRGVAQLVE